MAKSGIGHADVGDELSKAEWLSEESHQLVHGTSFPTTPVERQLFYRDDEHKWYVYNGTAWTELTVIAAGDMLKSTYDPNDDGVIALAQLDTAVCSETEADDKISTHTALPSAHHTKTADNEVAGLLSQGLASARPAAGIAGRLYYSTDTLVLERDTGTAWEEKARGETAIRLAQLS